VCARVKSIKLNHTFLFFFFKIQKQSVFSGKKKSQNPSLVGKVSETPKGHARTTRGPSPPSSLARAQKRKEREKKRRDDDDCASGEFYDDDEEKQQQQQ
jgi:hypothetical protein